MIKRLLISACALALPWSGAGAQQQVDVDPIFSRWASPIGPGCAVALARQGKTVVERAYGSADLEHDVPITSATIFEAGSVAKQFTAAAILLLAADGRLRLDEDVHKHIPELPDYGRRITIAHLLSHTSGLRDWGSVMEIAGWPRSTRAYTPADVLDIIVRQKSLNYAPGSEYSYTNSGYNLMAAIVERVSGSTLARFTADRIFKPLGMASTSWRDDFRRIVKGRAIAYQKKGADYEQAMPFEDAYGNGGLLTTTGDLLRWNEALNKGSLGRFVTTELERPATLASGAAITYASGLFVDRYRGEREVSHGGATGGYRAWLGRYPDRSLSIALLCNAGDANSSSLAHQVVDRFLTDLPAEPSPEPVAAGGRAGHFLNARTGMPLVLVEEGGSLKVKEGPPLQRLPDGRIRLSGAEIQFEGSDRFDSRMPEGQTFTYRRVQTWTPSRAELAEYAGRYSSDEAGAAYVASVEEGKLVLRLERRPDVVLRLSPFSRDLFEGGGTVVRVHRGPGKRISALGLANARVRDLRFVRGSRGR